MVPLFLKNLAGLKDEDELRKVVEGLQKDMCQRLIMFLFKKSFFECPKCYLCFRYYKVVYKEENKKFLGWGDGWANNAMFSPDGNIFSID